MKRIGAYEAKTNLSKILSEVAKGEEYAITKHGVPVAMIIPPRGTVTGSPEKVVQELMEFRKRHRLSVKEVRALIARGRK